MPAATSPLTITETVTPADQAAAAETVRECVANRTPVFTLGGQTSLGGGTATKQSGIGLSTAGLTRVIDYPARDMTITVEAGVTIEKLTATLAAENQFLPVDVAAPQAATIGGVMAANFSGPRRYGYGTLRDYVIGVSAVDGRGTPFKAGGRVVKNVAGYDFCKLLCGSLGTLAVITQVTLKVRPRPQASALVVYEAADLDAAESLLAALTTTRTTPVAVELLAGNAMPIACGFAPNAPTAVGLIIGFEGTAAEVDWLTAQLNRELAPLVARPKQVLRDAETADAWKQLTEFAAAGDSQSTILKLNVRPSRVVDLCKLIGTLVPKSSILAHAGSGIVLVDCGDLASHEAAKLLIQQLRPAAAAAGGQAVVYHAPSPEEWTRQAFWGPTRDDDIAMRTVKRQFDPHGILNPGRYIF